jgi:pilus assembly protein TadC
MKNLKNLKEWKTTLIGLISYGVAFYYLLKIEDHNIFAFMALLVFATLMIFSADSLVNSLSRFIKNNESKKL